MDRVSWFLVETGWEVVESEGQRVGHVKEVVGDTGKDIFNGLAVSPGLLKTTLYVPAEVVGAIEEGIVHLTISKQEFETLEHHGEVPPSEQFRAD
jgi:sporulation protein YlmC with PRC-barrel domain